MKWITKASLLGLFFLMSACSVSETGVPTTDLDSNPSECEASGSQFCDIEGSDVQLELLINTPNPIVAQTTQGSCQGISLDPTVTDTNSLPNPELLRFCFDVAGLCNEAGLGTASIVASVPANTIASFTTPRTLGTCRRGRFHVQLQVLFAVSSNELCMLHTLQLDLIGKRADGSEVVNESRGRQTIGFQVPNHAECFQ